MSVITIKRRMANLELPDEACFSGAVFSCYLQDAASFICNKAGYRLPRVKAIWSQEPNSPVAYCTANGEIIINSAHSFCPHVPTRAERFEEIFGKYAHELMHYLFTDFNCIQNFAAAADKGRWFPFPPKVEGEFSLKVNKARYEDFIQDEENRAAMAEVLGTLDNVLEDGYIEQLAYLVLSGRFTDGLSLARQLQYDDTPTVSGLVKEEFDHPDQRHMFMSIFTILLSYAKFGQIKYDEDNLVSDMNDPRVMAVRRVMNEVDEFMITPSSLGRRNIQNRIILKLWPEIEDYVLWLKNQPRQQQDDQNDSNGDQGQGNQGGQNSQSGQNGQAQGSNGYSGSGSITDKVKATIGQNPLMTQAPQGVGKGSENLAQQAINAALGQGQQDDDQNQAQTSGAQGQGQDPGQGQAQAQGQYGDIIMPGNSQNSEDIQANTEEEGGRIPLHETNEILPSAGTGVKIRKPYLPKADPEQAAKEIARLTEKIKEEQILAEMESEHAKGLSDYANSVSYGNAHKGVNIEIYRIAQVSEGAKQKYKKIAAPYIKIADQTARKILPLLKAKQERMYISGQYSGNRFKASRMVKQDGRYFASKKQPSDKPRLAIALGIDESGSMSSYNRSVNAKAAAITLYEMADKNHIPIMICGHTTVDTRSGEGVGLYPYADFDTVDKNDRYRLLDISARNCNRDGMALKFMAERLSKRSEEIKILIMISDGQPNAVGYHGTVAEKDMASIVSEYRRKGIIFFAAAIGNDQENIRRIYGGESFLNISDPNKLPETLAGLVRRFFR